MTNLVAAIKLKLDSSEVKKNIAKMKAGFRSMGKTLANGFKLAAKAGAALFVGLTAATVLYAKKFATEMDRIGKLSTRFKESAESMQRIAEVAKLGGTDIETVAKGIQNLVKNLVDGEDGTGEYADAIAALGLNASKLIELPMEDQLLAISRAFANTGNASARTLDNIRELLGRGGPEMAAMIAQGPEALAKAFGEVPVVSERVVRSMELINDSLTKMKGAVRAGFGGALESLVPVITEKLPELTEKFKLWAHVTGRAISDAFAGDSELLKAVFVVLGDEAGKVFAAALQKAAKKSLWDTPKKWGEGMEQGLYDWDAQRQIKANPGKTTFTGLYGGKINVADYQATKGIGEPGEVDPKVRAALEVIAEATERSAQELEWQRDAAQQIRDRKASAAALGY